MPTNDSSDQPSQGRPVERLETLLDAATQPGINHELQDQRYGDRDEDLEPLLDLEIHGSGRKLSDAAMQLLTAGRGRFQTENVFDFVPSNYEMLWDMLDAQPRGTFCEYGSGFGLATGIAELLGFDALGIELSPELVAASRELLASQGLKARVEQGDYLLRRDMADIYFTYAWPSQMRLIERHFLQIAPPTAKLLYCYGQSDIRCKILRNSVQPTV